MCRFNFDKRTFYLQTIASTDSRYLYNFVQMEGTKVKVLPLVVRYVLLLRLPIGRTAKMRELR